MFSNESSEIDRFVETFETQVNASSAGGLLAMNSDHVFARLQNIVCFFRNIVNSRILIRNLSDQDQFAVQVNLTSSSW